MLYQAYDYNGDFYNVFVGAKHVFFVCPSARPSITISLWRVSLLAAPVLTTWTVLHIQTTVSWPHMNLVLIDYLGVCVYLYERSPKEMLHLFIQILKKKMIKIGKVQLILEFDSKKATILCGIKNM